MDVQEHKALAEGLLRMECRANLSLEACVMMWAAMDMGREHHLTMEKAVLFPKQTAMTEVEAAMDVQEHEALAEGLLRMECRANLSLKACVMMWAAMDMGREHHLTMEKALLFPKQTAMTEVEA